MEHFVSGLHDAVRVVDRASVQALGIGRGRGQHSSPMLLFSQCVLALSAMFWIQKQVQSFGLRELTVLILFGRLLARFV